jgi:hypothetical protein
VYIDVDMHNLYKVPSPFKVYSSKFMQGVGDEAGEFYKGYVIKMKVNPMDMKFKHSARVFNNTNVTVTTVALDHHDLGGDIKAELQY